MQILEIIIIACAGAVLCICVKEFSPAMGAALTVCTAVVLTGFILKNIGVVLETLNLDILKKINGNGWIKLIIKCAFITYTAEIGCLICEDLGYKSFSDKILIASRLGVFAVLMPEFAKIFEYITGII